jgi:regulator of protease activity HflC (stomatin/prohibitin superfamily)
LRCPSLFAIQPDALRAAKTRTGIKHRDHIAARPAGIAILARKGPDRAAHRRGRRALFILEFAAVHPWITAFAIVAVALFLRSIRIANQYERGVVFRLGKFNRTAGPGLYFVWPLIEWQTKLDLRTVTRDVEEQEGITRDNVPIKVNAVIWFRIIDPERAVMQVREVAHAVVQVSVTTLRKALGQHTLDDILKAQDAISESMQTAIDSVTEPWGVKVELVQMKNVEIPPSMQRAMAQEAEALREKRARLIKAEAELDAAEQLRQAAEVIMRSPAGLELRRMQMITEVGAEQNTMTLVMMPSEFVAAARGIAQLAGSGTSG